MVLAKNWQYKTVFSIRLGHVERVADRIDPKPVMHLKPFSLSLSLFWSSILTLAHSPTSFSKEFCISIETEKNNARRPPSETRGNPSSETRRAVDHEDGGRRGVENVESTDDMARGAGEPSAKRAKADEADEEEQALVRRREELILGVENMRAKGKELEERLLREAEEEAERLKREAKAEAEAEGERMVLEAKKALDQHLPTVCAKLEAKNQKLLGRLLPELWQKILDENLHPNDLLALTMTCRFFRDTLEVLGWEVVTNLGRYHLLNLRKSGKVASHSLGWYRWVCDTFEILPGFEWFKRVEGAVYEGFLVNYAAFQGSVEILRWLIEDKGWELNLDTGWWGGSGGSIKVLEHLRGRGYKFDEMACSGAARGGHLEALKFLRGLDPPCPWHEDTCSWAARGGHLDVLKYLRAQNPPCPWNERTCEVAAREGRLEVLKWARSQDPPCPWDRWTCKEAAQGGHLEVLKWARSEDPPCPWDKRTCEGAANAGHLEILKWARSQDPPCPWSVMTCSEAAKGGHLDVLKFLRAQNPPCPWDERTCLGAAEEGHLEVLKWLRSQDPPCPWDERTCLGAAEEGHLEVLKWARSQDPPCPWDRDNCREKALVNGHPHIVDWIDQRENESDVE